MELLVIWILLSLVVMCMGSLFESKTLFWIGLTLLVMTAGIVV